MSVVGSIEKQPETVLRVCDELKREQSREIPAWMVDSAICALLKFSDAPVVNVEALRALADLLDHCICQDIGGVIDNSHSGFSLQGDTDASDTTRRPSVATRFAATSANDTWVGRSATASQGTRTAVAGAASEGPSARPRGSCKAKGGGR